MDFNFDDDNDGMTFEQASAVDLLPDMTVRQQHDTGSHDHGHSRSHGLYPSSVPDFGIPEGEPVGLTPSLYEEHEDVPLDMEAVIKSLHSISSHQQHQQHQQQAQFTGPMPSSMHSISAPVTTNATPSRSAASSAGGSPTRNRSSSKRRGSADRRRRKEPTRGEFETDEDFAYAWQKWRQSRDSNNRSVKRSREKARERAMEVERQKEVFASRISMLEKSIQEARALACKAFFSPATLTDMEKSQLTYWSKQP